MKKGLIYLFLILFLCFLQVCVLTGAIPYNFKPDMVLIFIVYLSLAEEWVPGIFLSWSAGCIQDVFIGSYLGLYGLALLLTFICIKAISSRLNTSNSLLLLFMVFCGTFLEAGFIMVFLAFFVDSSFLWASVLGRTFPQALLNFGVALVVLRGLLYLNGTPLEIPALQTLDKRHEP